MCHQVTLEILRLIRSADLSAMIFVRTPATIKHRRLTAPIQTSNRSQRVNYTTQLLAVLIRLTYVVYALIDDKRQRAHPPHRHALVVAQTGLFDVHVQVLHRVNHAQCIVHLPAGVRVAEHGNVQVRLAVLPQLSGLLARRFEVG
jgi:hypothetical protein